MNSIARAVGAIAIVATLQFHPQETSAQDSQTQGTRAQGTQAKGFTGKHFAQWSKDAQNSFIQTSITMAGIVLARVKPVKARCVDDWYGGEQKRQRNTFIRETITKFDAYHPGGTILAIIEQQCGKLK